MSGSRKALEMKEFLEASYNAFALRKQRRQLAADLCAFELGVILADPQLKGKRAKRAAADVVKAEYYKEVAVADEVYSEAIAVLEEGFRMIRDGDLT